MPIVGFVIMLVYPDALVWCKRLILDEPTVHQVNAGEYLSKISQQYYGDAKYWRELALVNRAPDSDLIFPGEEIFIPAIEVIMQLHQARSLSRVNSLVDAEKDVYAQNLKRNAVSEADTAKQIAATSGTVIESEELIRLEPENQSNIAQNAEKSSSMTLIFSIIGATIFCAAIAFVFYLKKNEHTETDEDEEAEPDYQKYKKSRSERVYV